MITGLTDLVTGGSAAHAIFILAAVAVSGLALGHVRVRGISLGVAGVLFAGLVSGHLGFSVHTEILEFTREFGLILFVYTIGLQVGPGFVDSLRRQGLPLNLMAAAIVLGGVLITVMVHALGGVPTPVAVGLFAGGTTNTPSLAAAQQALRDVPGVTPDIASLPGLGYAVSYPFGILGVILTMLLVRKTCRIDLSAEAEALAREQAARAFPPLTRMHLRVENRAWAGKTIRQVLKHVGLEGAVVISRALQAGVTQIARPDTVLNVGDVVLAVGCQNSLETLRQHLGSETPIDLTDLEGEITTTHLIVTRKSIVGRSVEELRFPESYGVTITRVSRAGVEFTPGPAVRLQLGDTLLAVGTREALDRAASEVGNSAAELGVPEIIPVFLGIGLGLVIGNCPMQVPGLPAPVRLGVAGGPLLVAIALSRVGRIGPLFWHLPLSANLALREIGIVLFLAAVGLRAGPLFMSTLLAGEGMRWLALAALITIIPVVATAFAARLLGKLNYFTLCGLLAGSMTDPPALAFAGTYTKSEAPSVAYATVYPLTMILRVLSAQLMVLCTMH